MIDKHTKEITGGKTYAELDQEDPNRAIAADSAFLQASLFTSVAFGVAGMAVAVGIVLTLIGFAIRTSAMDLARGADLGLAPTGSNSAA